MSELPSAPDSAHEPGPVGHALEELRQSEERFHLLVDAVTEYAIFMLDSTGHVMTWNSGAERIKGYAASEIIGKHFSTFYTDRDRAAHVPNTILDSVRATGHYTGEGWRVRKDGSLFWAGVVLSALRDDHGRLLGFAKVTRDLTDRRKHEEALRQSEERFRLLIDSISEYSICMLDPIGHVATWNRGAERMSGYTADEIMGRDFNVFFTAEDLRDELPLRELRQALATGRYESEGYRLRRDGARYWASILVMPLYDAHGLHLGFAAITRDLTERRQAEEVERRLLREQAAREAAQQLAARAEAANRIKDEFLATVSHELRTPLNAIVGWAAIMRQQAADANENALKSVMKAVEVIDRNARAQAKIVDDILDVSRIVTGKLKIDPKPTDLVQITQAAIEIVRPSALAKQIAIEITAPREGAPLIADAERLQQVAWNILSNAVKFTDPGGAIHVDVRPDHRSVTLTVTDTGAGIEPEFLPHVFERFKQADASITRRYGGLGLGLALARHIVELHGGSVSVQSAGLGTGSTFGVSLPVRAEVPALPPSPAGASPAEHAGDPRAAPMLRGLRVLVVDDDDDARELLSVVLTRAGAQVAIAANADDGFAMIGSFRPDVLVSDIGMADEDGYSFVRRVRALPAADGGDTPALALTAYSRVEDRTQAIAAGFGAHLGKPVNLEELLQTVERLAPSVRAAP
jgi:PAS domain S-box-containing protein